MIAEAGGRQLHVAETEKYAHVTYFFNGGREQEWEGEERCLVDSPRDVPTYDHKPEMSARGRRRRLRRALERGRLPLRDHQLRQPRHGRPHRRDPGRGRRRSRRSTPASARSSPRSTARGGACIVTADHGNCDHMLEPDGSPNTAHSLNPVPLIVTAEGLELRDGGILADVAPTALDLLGIPQPEAMTGRSLIARAEVARHRRPTHAADDEERPRQAEVRDRGPRRGRARRACSTPPTGRSRRRPSSRWRPRGRCGGSSRARSPSSATS